MCLIPLKIVLKNIRNTNKNLLLVIRIDRYIQTEKQTNLNKQTVYLSFPNARFYVVRYDFEARNLTYI